LKYSILLRDSDTVTEEGNLFSILGSNLSMDMELKAPV